jgi:hypothetical protein
MQSFSYPTFPILACPGSLDFKVIDRDIDRNRDIRGDRPELGGSQA